MAAFVYRAVDSKGKQQKGVLEADSGRQVRQQLRDKGWMPLSVEITTQKEKSKGVFSRSPKLSVPELALITRQLATLIQAGLPIDESLKALSDQTGKQRIKAMILAIRAKVLEGYTLAKALAEYPKAFPHLYRSTVSAGEHAGHLDSVLNRLADYTEARQSSDQKIKLAAMYPIILSIVALGIVIGLLTYVVPDIVDVFVKNGQELPGLTQFMLNLSHFITSWGLLTLALLIFAFIAFNMALKSPEFRKRWHFFLINMPGLGRFVKDAHTARYGSTVALLTCSGVPLFESMRMASQVVMNVPIQQAVAQATIKATEGSSVNKVLAETNFFPPSMLHMIASGENSGQLYSMHARPATQQETTLENTVEALVKIFEPMMLLVMGGIVATIVAAIMMPILELQKMVQ